MNEEYQEHTKKKTAQFVCDYRDEPSAGFLPQLQMRQTAETAPASLPEPAEETAPTIHVKVDTGDLEGAEPVSPVEELPAEEETAPEREGFPLWKRNNQPSRLFYPADPEVARRQEEQYRSKAAQEKPRGVLPGILLLTAAFAGVVCFCMFGGIQLVQSIEQLNAFLTPVMLQQPAPFASLSQASGDMTLQASVWRAVMEHREDYEETDEQGRMIVPAGDVEAASKELFGSDYRLPYQQPQSTSFFVYDETSHTYRVLPQSSMGENTPQIKQVQKENGAIIVTVEFSSEQEGAAVQTYRYILDFDALSGEPYLSSVQSA